MRCGVSLFADRRSCTQIKPYNRAHGIQLRNIMGDQEHCPSSAAPACVRHHGFFGLPVQTLERLIQEEQVVFRQQCPQDRHPAAHSAGEFPGWLPQTAGQPHRRQGVLSVPGSD